MKIGILGASSQVGSSLAFYFKKMTNIEPICFVRSTYSIPFFKMAEIEYKLISHANEWTNELFQHLDILIDCTYPAGQLYEINDQIKHQLKSIFPLLPKNTLFIYMSTIMAFGMPDGHKRVTHFYIPRTTYAYFKRRAEKLVHQLSYKYHIRGYNFRLGQVHGFLQSVNASYREKMSFAQDIVLDGNSNDSVNIIFISTLAEAILLTFKNSIKPGTYSLVEYPQWALQELYLYYIKYYSFENNLEFINQSNTLPSPEKTKFSIINLIKQFRSIIEIFFLIKSKYTYMKIKGKYRVLNSKQSSPNYLPKKYFTDFHLVGENPGPFIPGSVNDYGNVFDKEKKLESLYEQCIESKVKHG